MKELLKDAARDTAHFFLFNKHMRAIYAENAIFYSAILAYINFDYGYLPPALSFMQHHIGDGLSATVLSALIHIPMNKNHRVIEALAGTALAAGLEISDHFVPKATFDPRDLAAIAIGGALWIGGGIAKDKLVSTGVFEPIVKPFRKLQRKRYYY